MHKLKEYVCKELKDLEYKSEKDGKLSASDLQYADMLAHLKKNLLKAEEMEKESEYSNAMGRSYGRYYYDDGMSYADSYEDRSYDSQPGRSFVRPDGSYRDGGMSYARGRRGNVKRDSMGRYSRADEMEQGIRKLMEIAPDEQTKNELRKLMENM